MAESGTLTLLFTDLVNSTQLLGRAGDDAGHRLFAAHHKLMSNAISTNGGEELQRRRNDFASSMRYRNF